MGIPSENKNQINRTREEPDPSAFSVKPERTRKRARDCAARTRSRATCGTKICRTTASSIRGRNAETSQAHRRARPAEGRIARRSRRARHRPAAER